MKKTDIDYPHVASGLVIAAAFIGLMALIFSTQVQAHHHIILKPGETYSGKMVFSTGGNANLIKQKPKGLDWVLEENSPYCGVRPGDEHLGIICPAGTYDYKITAPTLPEGTICGSAELAAGNTNVTFTVGSIVDAYWRNRQGVCHCSQAALSKGQPGYLPEARYVCTNINLTNGVNSLAVPCFPSETSAC